MDSTLCAGLTTSLSTDHKTYTLLTSIHNNTDDADTADDADTTDDTDDANDYNRVIGIAQLKAFSCAKSDWFGGGRHVCILVPITVM